MKIFKWYRFTIREWNQCEVISIFWIDLVPIFKKLQIPSFQLIEFLYRFTSKSIAQFDSTFLLNLKLIAFRFSYYYSLYFHNLQIKAKGSRESMENLIQLKYKIYYCTSKIQILESETERAKSMNRKNARNLFLPKQNPLYNSKNRGNIRSLSRGASVFQKTWLHSKPNSSLVGVDPIETSFPIRSNLVFAIKRPRKGWN